MIVAFDTVVRHFTERIATVPLLIETMIPMSGAPAAPAPGTTTTLPTSPVTNAAVEDERYVGLLLDDIPASEIVLPPAAAMVTAAPLTVVVAPVFKTATVPLEIDTMMAERSAPEVPAPGTRTALPISPLTNEAVADDSWVGLLVDDIAPSATLRPCG